MEEVHPKVPCRSYQCLPMLECTHTQMIGKSPDVQFGEMRK